MIRLQNSGISAKETQCLENGMNLFLVINVNTKIVVYLQVGGYQFLFNKMLKIIIYDNITR